MSKSLKLFFLMLLSSPVYAHGAPPNRVIAAIVGVYFSPYMLGALIVGKGKRFWFTGISFLVYAGTIGLAFLSRNTNMDMLMLFYLFSPTILLIVAIVVRMKKAK